MSCLIVALCLLPDVSRATGPRLVDDLVFEHPALFDVRPQGEANLPAEWPGSGGAAVNWRREIGWWISAVGLGIFVVGVAGGAISAATNESGWDGGKYGPSGSSLAVAAGVVVGGGLLLTGIAIRDERCGCLP